MDNVNPDLVAVIMAGGAGTRFWPLSTEAQPKQFIPLFGEESLLQKSYQRVANLIPDQRILCMTNIAFTELAAQQLPNLPKANIIGEPERKDTAAAVCLASLIAQRRFDNPVVAILTADHLIEPVESFQKTLLSATQEAEKSNALYTFGVEPTWPATGYGYLELGEKTCETQGIEHYKITSFREKPQAETARKYFTSGRHLWNSGMFAWKPDSILAEFRQHLPRHLELLTKATDKLDTQAWEKALKTAFVNLERNSIDFAIMEKAANVRCVKGCFTWKDLGGWLAIQDFLDQDGQNNRVQGQLLTIDAENNLVFCENPAETVAMIGTRDLTVIRAGNKTLIAPKNRLEEIKQLVESMPPQGCSASASGHRAEGSFGVR